jgi:hypothetical protein
MISTPPHGNRSSFNLSPAEQIVARSDYAAIQERLLSPSPRGRHALDLSMDEVNALVEGPPRPPSPHWPATRQHRYLF